MLSTSPALVFAVSPPELCTFKRLGFGGRGWETTQRSDQRPRSSGANGRQARDGAASPLRHVSNCAMTSPPLLPVRACASGRSARALGRGPHALQTCPGTAVPAIITFPRLEEGRKCLLKGRRILSRVDVTSLSVISSRNQLSQRRSALWHPSAVCSAWHLRENALRRARKSAVSAGVTNLRSDPGSVPPQLRNHGSRVPRHR